jgi:hypothetical protein
VHPVLAGAAGDRHWWGPEPAPPTALEPLAAETFEDGVTWLRHRVVR